VATSERPRAFKAQRITDATGVSGQGHVADGVVFPDGTTVLRWLTQHRSTAIYSSFEEMKTIHGHNGATVFLFDDEQTATALRDQVAAALAGNERFMEELVDSEAFASATRRAINQYLSLAAARARCMGL
jgi:hypothetical protein